MAQQPRLLTGGNPQIPKGEGAAPVNAWIAAVPGWKREMAARLDALIEEAFPEVTRAVKWNSPLYGNGGTQRIIGMHATDRYLKLALFDGVDLEPPPPVGSKHPRVRYLHVFKNDQFDEARFKRWVRQAASLPGEKM